mgnify:CR=1 FL=1
MNMELSAVQNGQLVSGGPVAESLLANNMNPSVMRPFFNDRGQPCVSMVQNGKHVAVPAPNVNAVLRKDEWKQIDDAVSRVHRERLIGIQDLLNRGLTYNLTNPMATTVLEFEKVSDSGSAQMDMDGINRGTNDRPKFSLDYLPVPIIHADFQFNSRVLAASRKRGDPLDTTQAENSTRQVSEMQEDLLFTDEKYSFGGGTIYSYINHPSRMTYTISKAWDASDKTGAEIVDDIKAMKQKFINNRLYGPYVVYLPTNYETKLDEDYTSGYPKTIRARILEIENIDAVKVADHLPKDTVSMVQMSSDTIRLVNGMGATSTQWESEGGYAINFKVLAIRIPQIRTDYEGRTGVLHAAISSAANW